MPKRTASARWDGTLQEGSGTMRMKSGSYEGPYSFQSRFQEGDGTNPEELIAAAHAGCFSMALSGDLGRAGYDPSSVETTATVHLELEDSGPRIARIVLDTRASVPGISEDEFKQVAEGAKQNCPVSKALAAVETIEVNAELAS
jgi:osmotically inducible protein OsmC